MLIKEFIFKSLAYMSITIVLYGIKYFSKKSIDQRRADRIKSTNLTNVSKSGVYSVVGTVVEVLNPRYSLVSQRECAAYTFKALTKSVNNRREELLEYVKESDFVVKQGNKYCYVRSLNARFKFNIDYTEREAIRDENYKNILDLVKRGKKVGFNQENFMKNADIYEGVIAKGEKVRIVGYAEYRPHSFRGFSRSKLITGQGNSLLFRNDSSMVLNIFDENTFTSYKTSN